MTSLKIIKIFLASPDDVADECDLVVQLVNEESANHFEKQGYRVEVIGWGTHSSPGVGLPHPQGRNNRLIDDCTLFVGILRARFGSPTPFADSGTEEEFNYALARLADEGAPLRDIKMYFCDYSPPTSQIDVNQLGKVKEFRKRVRKLNTIQDWTISRKDEFEEEFRRHLSEWFYEYIGKGGAKGLGPLGQEEVQYPVPDPGQLADQFTSLNRGF